MLERCAGGIILKDNKVVIVSQKNNANTFPKGHIKKHETELEAAYREIHEETGLLSTNLTFIKALGNYTRLSGDTGNPKRIDMFLFTTKTQKLKPIDKTNPDAIWVDIHDIDNHLT